jgi:hypothetical protein
MADLNDTFLVLLLKIHCGVDYFLSLWHATYSRHIPILTIVLVRTNVQLLLKPVQKFSYYGLVIQFYYLLAGGRDH